MARRPEPRLCARREFCARGWSLLSLLTGFLPPSTTLMPYVTQFLQDAGRSQGARGRGSGLGLGSVGRGRKRLLTTARSSAELARTCQEHLQRTVKFGGRQRLLPPGEMKAFLVRGVQAAGVLGLPPGLGEPGPWSGED